MALAPKFAGQKFAAAKVPTLHILELYRPLLFSISAFTLFARAVASY